MSKRITLVHEDYEAALILKGFKKEHRIGVVRNLDDRVVDIAKQRPPSTHNTEQLIAFVPVATAVPFCASLARTYCQPLHDGSVDGGEDYLECYTINAITDQGAIHYDPDGIVVGRVIKMPCNFRQFNRIRNECKFYGEFFKDEADLDKYLQRNNYSLVNPKDDGMLPGDAPSQLSGNGTVPQGGGNSPDPLPKPNP